MKGNCYLCKREIDETEQIRGFCFKCYPIVRFTFREVNYHWRYDKETEEFFKEC